MSALTDALHEFVQASNGWAAAEHIQAMGGEAYTEEPVPFIVERAERRLARAGVAYETALAQFTADVARHAVT